MHRRSEVIHWDIVKLRRILSTGVLFLFVFSCISQSFLPLFHLLDVDAKEAKEHSCKGHPKSHVEKDHGPSHHDTSTCPTCQVIHSSQPTEIQTLQSIVSSAQTATFLPFALDSIDTRGPPLTGSSPRAPPPTL